jgi:hypothetical protein
MIDSDTPAPDLPSDGRGRQQQIRPASACDAWSSKRALHRGYGASQAREGEGPGGVGRADPSLSAGPLPHGSASVRFRLPARSTRPSERRTRNVCLTLGCITSQWLPRTRLQASRPTRAKQISSRKNSPRQFATRLDGTRWYEVHSSLAGRAIPRAVLLSQRESRDLLLPPRRPAGSLCVKSRP